MRKTVIFITFALIGALIGGCSSPTKTFDESFSEGQNYLKQLDFVKAEAAFAQMKETDSLSILNQYATGLVFEHKLLYLDALEVYLRMIDKDAASEEAYAGVFRCYMKLGSFEEALITATEYAKAPGGSLEAEVMMVEANMANGFLGDARKYINHLTRLESSSLLNFLNGRLFLAEGNYDSAQFYYNHGLSLDDQTAEFYTFAADYLVELGLYDSAVVVSNKFIELNPDELYYQIVSYERLLKIGYQDQARAILNLLQDNKIDPFITYWLELESGLVNSDYFLLREKIMRYMALNNKLFTLILRSLEVRSYLIEELFAGQNYLTLSNSVRPGQQSFSFIEYVKFYSVIKFSEFENSTRTRDNLLDITDERAQTRVYLLGLMTNNYNVGLYDEALKTADGFEKEYYDNIVWLNQLGNFYTNIKVRKYGKAARILKEALNISPTHTASFMKLLEGYEIQKQYQAALDQYDAFPQFEKTNKFTAFYKARLYLLNDEFDKFKTQFESQFSANDGNTSLLFLMAEELLARNDVDEIKYLVEQIQPVSSRSADLSALLGELLLKTGDFQAATDFIEQANGLERNNAYISILMARAKYHTGSVEAAFEIFEQNLKAYSNNPDNKYYYSKLLAQEKREFPKAANLARGSVFETRNDVKYVVNLAKIYYQMGRFDLAKGEASKSISLNKDNPQLYYQLGLAWSKLSDRKGYHIEAKEALEKAIQFGIVGEELKNARRIIKSL